MPYSVVKHLSILYYISRAKRRQFNGKTYQLINIKIAFIY